MATTSLPAASRSKANWPALPEVRHHPPHATALFSKFRGDKPLVLSCPHCGGEQTEAAMALSSLCRSCGGYFKIIDGKAVSNAPKAVNPFGDKEAPCPPARPPRHAPTAPEDPGEAASPPPTRSTAEGASRFKPVIRHTTARKGPQREIDCLECGRPHTIPATATSSLCPGCGSYISLQNHEINDDCNSRINTRGDVLVGRKGRIHGVMVRCYNLTVKGSFDGGVDCSAEFHLAGSATIAGQLRCRRLTLDKRARLELDRTGKADEMVIDGTVEGDLVCNGRVELKKHAHLRGSLTAGALVIRPGATHDGEVHITGGSLAERVSEELGGED